MRKLISLVLVLGLLLTSFTAVFAQESESLTDVKDTVYEEAVNALVEKGIIEGYPDGNFHPEDTISRAEACIIVTKSMNPTEQELEEALYSGFPDLLGFDWAKEYIRYAVEKAVVSGYPDGTFAPGDEVTYNEMAAMLVRALGYKVEDLSGDWPENFISKAEELGIMEGFTYEGDSPALRGHVAMMDYSVVDDIIEANMPEEDTEDEDEDKAGKLADYSGTAYGIVLSFAKILDEDGDVVDEVEFLFGNDILYLNTNGKIDVEAINLSDSFQDGHIFGLQMRNGIVRGIDTSANEFEDISGGDNFDILGYGKVTEVKNYFVTIEGDEGITILEDASIYKAVEEDGIITEYEPARIRDVKKDRFVYLYSATGDTPGVAEIVLIKEKNYR